MLFVPSLSKTVEQTDDTECFDAAIEEAKLKKDHPRQRGKLKITHENVQRIIHSSCTGRAQLVLLW